MKESIAVFFLICLPVVSGFICGSSIGYSQGQRDAKENKYHYAYETNITFSSTGETTTNILWKSNRK